MSPHDTTLANRWTVWLKRVTIHRLYIAACVAVGAVIMTQATAQPAGAAGFDACTPVRLARPLVNLITGSIKNFFDAYGWWAVGIIFILAIAVSAFANAGSWWKRLFWIIFAVVAAGQLLTLSGASATVCA